MGKKKLNEKFVAKFKEVDLACCNKFGVAVGGVNEYMNCLNNVRFAPNRDEVLHRLVKYSGVFQRLEYNPQDKKRSLGVGKSDISWLVKFKKSILKKKDPISAYLRKAKSFAARKKFGKVMLVILILAIVAAAVGVGLFLL